MTTTISRDYLDLDQAKKQLELAGTDFADADLADAISAASRDIDDRTHRRFYPDPDAAQVRYYSPQRAGGFEIDDLCELTSLEVVSGGVSSAWAVDVDFVLEPLNASADYRPWERVVVLHPSLSALLGTSVVSPGAVGAQSGGWAPKSVRVTGRFGWDQIPAGVVTATKILAARYLLRTRQAPLGIVSAFSESGGVMMRVARADPDVQLTGLVRDTLIA